MPLQELVEYSTLRGAPTNCRVLSRVVFSSAEWFGTEFREFAPIFALRNRIPCCFLFHWKVWKGIPRVCSSAEWFETKFREFAPIFAPTLKGSEWNSEGSLLFLVYGTEFRVVFSSAEGFGTEFREFLFRGTVGIPSEITICSVNSVFGGIIFLSEIPNPMRDGLPSISILYM